MPNSSDVSIRITADGAVLVKEVGNADASLQRLAKTGKETNNTLGQSLSSNVRNVSYQLQDMAVQIGGGTSAMVAMSQQLPQMLIGFGAFGAVVGTVLSLAPALVAMFTSSAASAKTLKQATSELQNAIGDIGSTARSFDLDNLYKQYNASSIAARQATIEQLKFQSALIETSRLTAERKFGETTAGLGDYSTLEKLKGAFGASGAEKLAKDLGITLDAARELAPVLKGLRDGTEDISLTFTRFGRVLLTGNEKARELALGLKDMSKAQVDGYAASTALSSALRKMGDGTHAVAVGAKKSSDAYKEMVSWMQKQADAELDLSRKRKQAEEAAARSLQAFYEEARRSNVEAERRVEALETDAAAMREQAERIGLTRQQLVELTARKLDDAIATKEQTLAAAQWGNEAEEDIALIKRQIAALKEKRAAGLDAGSREAMQEQIEAARDAARASEAEWKRTADSIESSLTDALMRGFEGGKDWAKNFGETLKNMFGSLVLRPVIQAVLAPVAGGAASLFSGSASASGGGLGSLGGIGNLFGGAASGLGDLIFGGGGGAAFGAGFASPLSTLGSIFGGVGEFAAPGLALASGLGAAVPVIGAALAIGSLIASANKTPAQARGQFQVGGGGFEDNAYVSSRFGSLGFADAGTQQFSGEAAKSFSAVIGKVLDAAAEQMSPQQVARTAEKLNATIFEALEGTFTTQDFLSKYGADILQQTVSVAFDELNPRLAELMRAFAGSAEEMADYAERLIQTQAFIAQAADAYNGIYAGLSADDVLALAEAFGGLGNVMSATDGYMSALYSDTERLALTADALRRQFADLGVAMPESKEAFRGLVEGIDLTTEEGRSLYTELLRVAPAFVAVSNAAADSAEAMRRAAESLRGDMAAFDSLQTSRGADRATISRNSLIDQYLSADSARGADFKSAYGGDYGAYASAIGGMQRDEFSQFGDSDRDVLLQIIKAQQDLTTEYTKTVSAVEAVVEPTRDFYEAVDDGAAAVAEVAKAQDWSNAIASKGIELLQAQGREIEALNAQRDLELQSLQGAPEALTALVGALYDLRIEAINNAEAQRAAEEQAKASEVARQAAADQAREAESIAAVRDRLRIEQLRLEGDATSALVAERYLELKALPESVRALQVHVWTLQDQAAAAEAASQAAAKQSEYAAQQREMSLRLMELEGDAEGALAERRKDALAALNTGLRADQERIWLLEDQAEAMKQQEAAAAQASAELERATLAQRAHAEEVAKTRAAMEIEVMRLGGDQAGATSATRASELAALDALLRPLQERIYALQDEAAATEKANALTAARAQMDVRVLELSGDAAGALAASRALELDALNESLRPLQQRIYALQDESVAASKAAEVAAQAAALADARGALDIQIMQLSGREADALAATRARELATMDESLRPLQQRVYALQDEAAESVKQAQVEATAREEAEAAAQRAAALAGQRRALEIDLMRAGGDEIGAVAAQRADELAAADASLRPLMERLYALRDEAAAAELAAAANEQAAQAIAAAAERAKQIAAARAQFEIRIMELSGDAAGALAAQRAIEIEQIDESLRPLQQRIWALEDAAAAEDNATRAVRERETAIAEARDVLATAYRRESSELQGVIDRSRSAASALRSFRDGLSIGNLSPLSPEDMLRATRNRFDNTASAALAGDEAAMQSLQSAASSYLESARAYYASSQGYQDAFASVSGVVDTVAADADASAIIAEQQLAAMTTQVQGLIDVKEAVVSVRDAIRELIAVSTNGGSAARVDVTASLAQITAGFADKVGAIVDTSAKKMVAQLID